MRLVYERASAGGGDDDGGEEIKRKRDAYTEQTNCTVRHPTDTLADSITLQLGLSGVRIGARERTVLLSSQ